MTFTKLNNSIFEKVILFTAIKELSEDIGSGKKYMIVYK
jgi:hypothetical protein